MSHVILTAERTKFPRFFITQFPPNLSIMNDNEQLQNEATEVMLVLEDCVEHICRENTLSGEKVWVMVGALANAKLKEFPTDEED